MKRTISFVISQILIGALLIVTLTACGGTSGTTSGNASEETVQTSTTPAGSENTTPEPDPSPESSKQPVADDPAPTSDELPNGYLDLKEDTTYCIYGQLDEPGNVIAEIETPYAYHTFFVPTLPEEVTTLFSEHDLNYFCRYTAQKNSIGRECYLYAYDNYAEITYTPSSGLFSERVYDFNAGIAITQSNATPPIYITIVMSAAPGKDNFITMQDYSSSTTIEFSETTFSPGEEHIAALKEAINSGAQ